MIIRIRRKPIEEAISAAGTGFIIGYVLPPNSFGDAAICSVLCVVTSVSFSVLMERIKQRRLRRARAEAEQEYQQVKETVERERTERQGEP